MSTPAEQLDQAPPSPPMEPKAPPPSTPLASQNLSNAYMAHTDTMRGAAAADELNASLKGQEAQEKPAQEPPKPPEPPSTVMGKAGAVAKDIGTGIIETPRAVVKGVRDAYQSMLDLAKDAGDFTNKYFPALQVTGPGAPRIVSAAQRAADPSLPGSLVDNLHLPNIEDPKSVTGSIEKNIVQFVTGLSAAGGQIKALGVPAVTSGFGKTAMTAVHGFLGQFEAFDGSQQNLSNLIQSVPSLQNPVTKFLATDPSDSDAVNRLKSSVEGVVGAKFVESLVGGLRFLRGVNAAKESAEHAAGLAEGNEDLGENIGKPTEIPENEGLAALGDHLEDDSKPLVSAKFNEGEVKIAQQMQATGDTAPGEVAKMGEAAYKTGVVKSADDVAALPDPEDGYTRLYRATSPTQGFHDVFDPAKLPGYEAADIEGQHYTADYNHANYYEDAYNANKDASTSYVDVPTSQLGREIAPGEYKLDLSKNKLAGPASPGATEVQAKEPAVYVNFSRINGPDDVKRAMSQLADTFKDNIDDARRGVQTFEDTKLGADSVNAWDTLMSRRVGEPLNAEQSLAARQLWASSASKTMDLASIASETPTPDNLFAFRKMLATHAAIQEQVIAARTETARALSSWRIPAGDDAGARMAQVLQSLKQDSGPMSDGLSVSLNMAQRVKALSEAMDVEGLNGFSEKSAYATTRDAVLETWTNMLLTSPLTHVKVTVSNAATAMLRIGERAAAAQYSNILGDSNGVALGEASAQYSGLVSGLKDAFRYAGRAANAFLNEEPIPPLGDDPLSNAIKAAKTGQYSAGEDAVDHNFSGAVSSQAFNITESGWLGKGVDLLGQVIRSPGRALTAEHDFFRSISYRMELNALATRQATQDVQAGRITEDGLGGRIQEILANPPPSVTMGAQDAMKYQTFTDAPGKLANLIEQARTDFPLVRVILPFYKIPSRILSFTFERSPLAPLMSSYRANIAAGGAREALARAQMGLGTAMMLATADAVLSGQVTGSGPPQKAQRGAMQNTGWLPYSMKVGDHWVQYNHLETVGSSMAMAADVVETMHSYGQAVNGDNPDMEKLAIATALSVAQDITSKTYLQGLSNFFQTLANPKTEGEHQAQSLSGSLVPAGVAAIDRVQDPYQRSVYSIMDAIKARTPGASQTLPPRRDVWGKPIEHASGMGTAYDMLSPFATRQPTDSPIDREITRLGANVNLPEGRTSFGQGAMVDLHKDPAMYSRYVELAGNGYKDPAWDSGAHDMLNSLVSGNHPLSAVYNMKSDGPDGGKAGMIHSILEQYRDGAKRQLLQEYPKLQEEVTQKTQDRQALKMPVLQ